MLEEKERLTAQGFYSQNLEIKVFQIENVRIKKFFLIPFLIAIALLVSQFGFSIMVINPLIDTFKTRFGWTDDNAQGYVSLLSFINPLGGLCGTFIAKFLIERGRQRAIIIANFVIIAGTVLTMFETIWLITLGRFVQGVACCGFSTVIVPKFIYETAPVSMRGPCGGMTQLSAFCGCLLCFTLGFGTPETHEEKMASSYWRLMFIVPAIIAVVQLALVMTVFSYETPVFSLLVKKDEAEARRCLSRIYYEEDISDIVQYIKDNSKGSGKTQSFGDALCGKDYWKPTWVGFFLQFFNQFSGMVVVNLFSSQIFTSAGINAKQGTFYVGVANAVGSVIPIILINKFGRKTLLYTSFGLMFVCHALIVLSYTRDIDSLLLLMIVLYLFAYQLGAGPLPYVYITDTCYDAGMSFGTISMWFWMLFVTLVAPFLIMNQSIGITGTFLILCGTSFLGFVYCIIVLKETKGLTDDQCKKIFDSGNKR